MSASPKTPLLHHVPVTFSRSFVIASVLLAPALPIGIGGYHFIAGLSWSDALLNASMILTGMGPVSPLNSIAAKVFA